MTPTASGFTFSREAYESVLGAINRSGYRWSTFSEVAAAMPDMASCQTCLMRHDVDISMDFAVDMAKVEYSHSVRSTYFLMLRSPLYNLMSRHGSAAMMQLVDLGHDIGLHFDAGFSLRSSMGMDKDLRFELDTLSRLIGREVRAFSFHQPSEDAIRLRIAVPEVINTYHPEQLPSFKYVSDSNRVWRDLDPFQLVACGFQQIQILIHPVWWMCEEVHTFDCWDRAIERNFQSEQRQILDTERAYGPKRSVRVVRIPDDGIPEIGTGEAAE